MFGWLRKLRGRGIPPLEGAPATPRMKTYAAASGYVYQYFYQGHRVSDAPGEAAVEHVFQVSSDRRAYFPVSVYLTGAAVEDWEREHARPLNATERYAVAKMALFQAFDEREGALARGESAIVRRSEIDPIAETLGFV
jgi:hypothetical protein